MAILRVLLVVIEVLSSALLTAVILIQKPKSHGAGLAFGAGLGESLFGARMGNVLTKTTVVLGIVFLVNTTFLSMLGVGPERSIMEEAGTAVPVETPGAAVPLETTPPTSGGVGAGADLGGVAIPVVAPEAGRAAESPPVAPVQPPSDTAAPGAGGQ